MNQPDRAKTIDLVLLHRPVRNRGMLTRRTVGEFRDLRHLDSDAFVRMFPNPVLLVHPVDPQVGDEALTQRCDVKAPPVVSVPRRAGLPEDLTPVRVLTVRKKASSEGETIWLGRSRRCDLLIVDRTISKMHALITYDHRGRLVIGDASSTNGTFLDERRLETGQMVPLNDRAHLRLGSLAVTFLLPQTFFKLI